MFHRFYVKQFSSLANKHTEILYTHTHCYITETRASTAKRKNICQNHVMLTHNKNNNNNDSEYYLTCRPLPQVKKGRAVVETTSCSHPQQQKQQQLGVLLDLSAKLLPQVKKEEHLSKPRHALSHPLPPPRSPPPRSSTRRRPSRPPGAASPASGRAEDGLRSCRRPPRRTRRPVGGRKPWLSSLLGVINYRVGKLVSSRQGGPGATEPNDLISLWESESRRSLSLERRIEGLG